MDKHNLGFITPGGLAGLVITSIVIILAMFLGGNQLFSSGPLSQRSSGQVLGDVSSHVELSKECGACHPAPWSRVTQNDLCLECHDDVNQQLADNKTLHGAIWSTGGAFTCRTCHTDHIGPDAILTTYQGDEFPHDLVGYSLTAHSNLSGTREITCRDCHHDSIQTFNVDTCKICHEEVDSFFIREHLGYYGVSCLECHDGLETITGSYSHDAGEFLLTGAHIAASCAACHQDSETLDQFAETPINCVSCHLDQDVHQASLGEHCDECHTTTAWIPALYDHGLTGFPLTLGHSGLACADCHGDPTFQGLATECYSCHAGDDPHELQFGENCETCHSTAGWDLVSFDHTGPYTEMCTTCHLEDSPINHYPGQCSFCHNTSGWIPAFFSHVFPINHGGTQNSCTLCHISANYSSYTCYGCHEHSRSKIINEHEGISNLANCIRCHPDGRSHDDGGDD